MVRRSYIVLVIAVTIGEPAQAPPALHTPKLPIRFEANLGQWDDRVRFVARGAGKMLITDDGMTLGPVTLRLVGEGPSTVRGEGELVTRSNFFLGNDPARWRTNVPSYARVRSTRGLRGVDGSAGGGTSRTPVDVVWHAEGQGLEYDIVVGSGVDARTLTFEVGGTNESEVIEDGSLAMMTDAGTLVQRAPRVIQGRRDLRARFVRRDATHFGFAIDGYDKAQAALIDPVFAYSTYFGGSQSDQSFAIAVDASGNMYVTGLTESPDFPTMNAIQKSDAGYSDVFVSKLDAAGSSLVYSTYLGGSEGDMGNAIAVDGSGEVYVTGYTGSTDFPTYGAVESGDGSSAFVTKLDASGSALVFSTYLGTNGIDEGNAIALDTSGNAYVAGYSTSTGIATAGAFQTSFAGGVDAFVTELTGAGALVYTTYLGGSNYDEGYGIAVDAAGNAYVAGSTESTDFPTEAPFQSTSAGATNAFVTKLSASGSSLVYSTYLGGSQQDFALAIAIDSSGAAYVAGYAASPDFPTLAPFQSMNAGEGDCFISKLNPSASALVYSSFLGGSKVDRGTGIAVDASGNAYVTGYTTSVDFPLENAMQTTLDGSYDAFVAKVGTGLVYSTYLGGSSIDEGMGITASASGNAYTTGWTSSVDFPTAGPLQPKFGGGSDGYISEIITPNLGSGAPCSADGACESNHCVDGVCCDTACTDQCTACDVSGQVGTCVGVVGPPHGGRQVCNGSGACAGSCDGVHSVCTYSLGSCGSTCSNGSEIDSVCDGDGGCNAQAPFSCNSFACNGGSRCKTACLTNNDCVAGSACLNGVCLPPAVCVNDHRSQNSDGTTADCTPFACGASGVCNATCAVTSDCAAGWVCTADECVLPPYPGGCSVGSSHRDERTPWLLALLLLVRRRLRANVVDALRSG